MDLVTLRRIIQRESPVRLDVGTVVAADPRGTRSVSVRLSGGHVCSRVLTCVDDLEVGDQVLIARMMQLGKVVVLGQLLSDAYPTLARSGILAPPDNLSFTPVPAAIVVRWDTYPGEDLCWQVQYNSSASGTGATDELVTRGSYYTHYVVDSSGDMDPAATVYFRVRAVRWLGDNNVMYSAWSSWGNATSGGHNLREIVELEFEDATELTLNSQGQITRTQVYHTVDTENNDPTDDLVRIQGGTEGDLIIITPADDGRTIVVKHDVNNIWLMGKADITLDDLNDHLILIREASSKWCDLGGGGGGGGSSTFLGLTDTPADYVDDGGKWVRVKDTEDGLEFGDLSDLIGDLSDLEDVSDDSPEDGDALVWSQASFHWEPGLPRMTFPELTDTPANYVGHARKFPMVDDVGAALVFIAAAGWLQVGDNSELRWQPDSCARLRGGVVVEYPDPDGAFASANQAGDVVLVPPGAWTLTQTHSLANHVAVFGLGPAESCILQSTLATPIPIIAVSKAAIQNVSIDFKTTYAGTIVGLALSSESVARTVLVRAENEDTGIAPAAYGIQAIGADVLGCRTRAYTNGRGGTAGVKLTGGSMEDSYCYAYTTDAAGNVRGIETLSSPEISRSTGKSAGQAGSTRYGILSSTGVTVLRHCYLSGDTCDIKCTTPGDAVVLYSVEYNTVDDITKMIYRAGDRTAGDHNEYITGYWTYDHQVRFKELAAHPVGPGTSGYVELYAKDLAGQSKFYFKDDTATSWEIAGVARDVAVTVRAVGGDFTTIQAAIDFFKGWIVMGTCTITCDPDVYVEHVSFADIVMGAGSALQLLGDARLLAGASYVDGMLLDRLAVFGPNYGSGLCALANAGNNITVTGATTNPDFDADGWGAGDRILVKDNANAITEQTIDSVLNNVITLTGAAPAVGNNGSAIGMVPDRAIEPATAGVCVTASGLKGIQVWGFYLKSSTGTSCHGLQAGAGAAVGYRHLLAYCEDYCFYSSGAGTSISFSGYHPSSCWSGNPTNNLMVISTGGAAIACTFLQVVGPGIVTTTSGFYSQHLASIWAVYVEVSGCETAVKAMWQSEIFAALSMVRYNDVGYQSTGNSMIVATTTMGYVNNITDYDPDPPGGNQYEESPTTFGVLYKS